MALISQGKNLTEADYLAGEQHSEIRHEYVDGKIHPKSSANRDHNRITLTFARNLADHLETTPCTTFVSDMKVKAAGNFFCPDALVVCEDEAGDPFFTEAPILIVEVLSHTTRRYDRTVKLRAYQSLPSLQACVLIEQELVDVEVCRRSSGWQSEHYFLGDEVRLESVGAVIPVIEIYRRTQIEEVQTFLDGTDFRNA